MDKSSNALLIVGPSGSGKSSLVAELSALGLIEVHPTWTTRPPRAYEKEGSIDHRFVDSNEFDARMDDGFFQKTGSISGLPYRYGLPKFDPTSEGLVSGYILRAKYASAFRKLVPNVVIYQISASHQAIQDRLVARTTRDSTSATRVKDNVQEIALGIQIADRSFSNDGDLGDLLGKVLDSFALDFGGTKILNSSQSAA